MFRLLFIAILPEYQNIHKKVKKFLSRPEETLRFPPGRGSQFSRQSAHEGGKVVSPTHRPPLLPSKYS